ncbi:putative DNA modification/repair radical SAM protein [Pseudomonadales bacterium]|nr:putative DNA modification/repair radical SAM protein [Pseudomonadales bacterium]
MELIQKLEILADAAKYDASCASSGGARRDSRSGRGIGSTGGMGICHSYAPDGRCISLLKILLTNFCQYECHYCINRNSSNVTRARFTVDEVVQLTLDFYKRNYIEGLFLSSGIIQSPDYTMEQLVFVARDLREKHDFRGYIHLKTIPDADGDLLAQAGRYADRLSINMELPTQHTLSALAPEKDHRTIKRSMARIHVREEEAKEDAKKCKEKPSVSAPSDGSGRRRKAQRFAPAGQSTQMIIGADDSNDTTILKTSAELYAGFRLRRVYYSAFSPIPEASISLPAKPAPLLREHRLYQADWLLRFYEFSPQDIFRATEGSGMLPLDIDPKLAWALNHRDQFPVDLNRASKEQLLKVPGIGVKTVKQLLRIRRWQKIKLQDLISLRAGVKKAMPFIVCADHHPGTRDFSSGDLRGRLAAPVAQMALF